MLKNLHDKLTCLPSGPGVYLMKAANGKIIYVGKAQNLKKRVSSYFRPHEKLDTKTGVLVKNMVDYETIVTGTEKEALILESNLIKRYKPKYNVILKDDKRYPALRLDTKEAYPCLTIVRKIGIDSALYFGPFASAQAVRQTLKIIQKTFKLRKCKHRDFKNRSRPCLNYQMGACLAPCCLPVDQEVYNDIVREVVLFLKGRTPELIKKIKKQMQLHADRQEYENAAFLRDKLFALEKTLEKQVSVSTDLKDRDILAVAGGVETAVLIILTVRGGYLQGSRHFSFSKTFSDEAELLGAFLRQYYDKNHFIPDEVLLATIPEDASIIEECLKDLKGTRVRIIQPKRGEKFRLLKMATRNAYNQLNSQTVSTAKEMEILHRLQFKLRMGQLPIRIECIDSSNISGKEPVGSMVVFENGKPQKSAYRKYKLRPASGPDDYAYLAEILTRRYGNAERAMPYPEILVVDGGKGQLNVAISVLKKLNLEKALTIIGIAKKNDRKKETEDKIYLAGRANPLNFNRDPDVLFFLQRIRDEAHRFAITFHRKRLKALSMRSTLDSVPGIGTKRKKILLKHFGSLKKIRAASLDELSGLPGMNLNLAMKLQQKLTE